MAFTPKLYETCLGADEDPWASDTDGNSISIDQTAGTPTIKVVNANDAIEITNATNGRSKAWQTTQGTFTNGAIRSLVKSGNWGGSANTNALLLLRTGTGTDGIECGIGADGTSPDGRIDIRNYAGAFIGSVDMNLSSDTWYQFLFYANGTSVKALAYLDTVFPPGSDYKTITWSYENTSASYDSGAGHAGIGMQRSGTTTTTSFKNILAFADGAVVDVGSVSLLSETSSGFDVLFGDPSGDEFRGSLWYFMRLKSGSQPTDENDGTLITGPGLGMGPTDDIRSDGRFLSAFAQKTLSGLDPNTTYYVRPFAVQMDGTITAGTSQSITTLSGAAAQSRIQVVRSNLRW